MHCNNVRFECVATYCLFHVIDKSWRGGEMSVVRQSPRGEMSDAREPVSGVNAVKMFRLNGQSSRLRLGFGLRSIKRTAAQYVGTIG